MTTAEQITDRVAYHGEGPMWDGPAGVIRWMDMLHGDILTMRPGIGEIRRRHVGDIAAAMRPRTRGGLVVAIERGFILVDDVDAPDDASADPGVTVLDELWSDPRVRMNEGGCDPQGRFYCGSMEFDGAAGRGNVFRLDPDYSVNLVMGGVTISNGMVWALDGSEVYYIDSRTHRVSAYRFDPLVGAFHARRTVVEIPASVGTPDGMTIDVDGGLWVALYGGSAVHRYLPDGSLDHVIELPASRVTACTFGGENLDELYITTSREHLPDDEQPLAGALFRAIPGVCGVPVAPFAG